jgi:hypothetical protein
VVQRLEAIGCEVVEAYGIVHDKDVGLFSCLATATTAQDVGRSVRRLK